MSVLSVEEFEAVVGTGADTAIIQDVIDREESELAHLLGGSLAGARTDTYHPGYGYAGPVWLRRFADTVIVTDAGAACEVRLVANGGAIERPWMYWVSPVVVTYAPNDEWRMTRALIELVRDAIIPDRDREAGSARDDRDLIARRNRARLVRGLRPGPRSGTITIGTTDRLTPLYSG